TTANKSDRASASRPRGRARGTVEAEATPIAVATASEPHADVLSDFVAETNAQAERPPRNGRGRRRAPAKAETAPQAIDPLAVIDLGEANDSFEPTGFAASPADVRPRDARPRPPRPDRPQRPDAPRQNGRDRYDRNQDDGPSVLAFGDDVPAFMRIPTHNRP
ncbi:MAG: hypothetical protein RL186_724, partial [Pseudomonadota bacterium]